MNEKTIDNLLKRGEYTMTTFFPKCQTNEEDLILLLMLWKNLETLEGINVLLKQGLTYSAKPLLRVLFENSIYIEWILKEHSNTTNKLKQIEFCQLKSKLLLYKNFFNILNQTNLNEKQINLSQEILSKKYEIIRIEWDKSSKIKRGIPNWYSLFGGPKNLRELSRLTNSEKYYLTIYTSLSENIHSLDLFDKLKITDNIISLSTINHSEINSINTIIFSLMSQNYLSITKYFDKEYKKSDIFLWFESFNI